MHAASGKPTKAPRAGLLGGDCGRGPAEGSGPGEGPGLAEGGRGASRSIFASCSVTRASCSSARLICSWACASPSSERAMWASWGLVSFGSGVEFIGVSLSVQCHPKVAGRPAARTPVLSKGWPYDGERGHMRTIGAGIIISRRVSSRWYPRSFQRHRARRAGQWRGCPWGR